MEGYFALLEASRDSLPYKDWTPLACPSALSPSTSTPIPETSTKRKERKPCDIVIPSDDGKKGPPSPNSVSNPIPIPKKTKVKAAGPLASRDIRVIKGEDVPTETYIHYSGGGVKRVFTGSEEVAELLEHWAGPRTPPELPDETRVHVEDVYIAGLKRAPSTIMRQLSEVEMVWEGLVVDVGEEIGRLLLRGFQGLVYFNCGTQIEEEGRLKHQGDRLLPADGLRALLRPGKGVSAGCVERGNLLYATALSIPPQAPEALEAVEGVIAVATPSYMAGAAISSTGGKMGWVGTEGSLDHGECLEAIRRESVAQPPSLSESGWVRPHRSVALLLVPIPNWLREDRQDIIHALPFPVTHWALVAEPLGYEETLEAEVESVERNHTVLKTGELEVDPSSVFPVPNAGFLEIFCGREVVGREHLIIGERVKVEVCPEISNRRCTHRALRIL